MTVRERLLAMPLTPALGGDGTRPIATEKAFSFPAVNLAQAHQRTFFFGNRLFNTNWVQAPGSVKSFDGLGPVFNRVSCSGCHLRDGRGTPPAAPGEEMLSMLVRLSIAGEAPADAPVPHPVYGDQINDHAILGVPPEARVTIAYKERPGQYADGAPYSLRAPDYTVVEPAFGPLGEGVMLSPRVAPATIGLGLLEAVPEDIILALADPDDADGDGISGRANRVPDKASGRTRLGRFGWKANQPSLRQQNAGAALGDIGLTTSMFAEQNCGASQDACRAAASGGSPEVSDVFLDKLTLYTALLAVPAQRGAERPEVHRGEALFRAAGCAACHMPTLVTGDHELEELANQVIHPFTDLLLHDMGEGLADHRPDYEADGKEWRTPPLWGIGLVETVNGHTNFLHDGRARNLAEAILWHGGEAEAAGEAFRGLPKDDRDALIAFLNSL